MMSDDIAIKISDVHVSFGNHHVLKGASGEIKKGSIEGRTLSSFSASEMAQKVAFLPQVHEIPRDMTTEELGRGGTYGWGEGDPCFYRLCV